MVFLFVILYVVQAAAHPQNLTHSSYLYYDFSDETFDARYDPKYTRGKHCAAQYLAVDYNTHSYGHTLFENCVTSVHPLAIHDYAMTTTRRLFTEIYDIFDNYTRHVFLHDEELDSLYETYVDIQHDFQTYKLDIVQTAKSFVRPVNALTMSSSATDAKKALQTSTDIMAKLHTTVQSWAEIYDAVIDAKDAKAKSYEAKEDAEWIRLHEAKHTYIENVSTMLQQLTLVPNVYVKCAKGYWCSNGITTACPAGTFQPAENMTRPLACIQNPMGTYSKQGSANWTICNTNTHVSATACHIRPLHSIIKSGVIAEDFYITHDFSRIYSNGTLLTATQTANSTTGTILQRIQNLTGEGASLLSAYTTAKLESLRSEDVTLFENTDLDYHNQTNLSSFRIPYAANTYNVSIDTGVWSIVHVTTNQVLVSGTVNGTRLEGVPSTSFGMIGDLGYPIIYITFILT